MLTVPIVFSITPANGILKYWQFVLLVAAIDVAAVRVSQLRYATYRRDRERYAIEAIGRAVAAAPGLERVADTLQAQGPVLLGVPGRFRLWHLEPVHDTLRLIATGDQVVIGRERRGQASPDQLRYSLSEPVACAQVARFKKEIEVSDLRAASFDLATSRQMAQRDGYLSILAVPMMNRRHLVGVLTFEPRARRPYKFASRQRSYLWTMAGMGAVGIDALASGVG
jgi:GAF domain-containing protein